MLDKGSCTGICIEAIISSKQELFLGDLLKVQMYKKKIDETSGVLGQIGHASDFGFSIRKKTNS